jgi:hypothetical protein
MNVGGDGSAGGKSPSAGVPARNGEAHEMPANVTESVEGVLAAAQRSAAEIRTHAAAEATALVEQRLAGADAQAAAREASAAHVLERARVAVGRVGRSVSAMREQIRFLDRELEQTAAGLEEMLSVIDSAAHYSQPRSDDGRSEVDRGAPGTAAATGRFVPAGQGVRRSALVRASQMAMRGRTRAEIGSALRDELGIADPTPILDEALGADRSGAG